jgi:hypothetical protein
MGRKTGGQKNTAASGPDCRAKSRAPGAPGRGIKIAQLALADQERAASGIGSGGSIGDS